METNLGCLTEAWFGLLIFFLFGFNAPPGTTALCHISNPNPAITVWGGPGREYQKINETLGPVPDDIYIAGQAKARDGSLWWELRGASNSGASRWVAQADVAIIGDCASVPFVTPPLLRPIVRPPLPRGTPRPVSPGVAPHR